MAARFALGQYVKGSLWVLPLLGGVFGGLLAQGTLVLDSAVRLPAGWNYTASTASGVLTAIVGAMVALLGFVVTIGVLVVQQATGTLSPRYMRLWYCDRLQKVVLATELCESYVLENGGVTKLVIPRRAWVDYLQVAVTEVRDYGAGSVQVCRRAAGAPRGTAGRRAARSASCGGGGAAAPGGGRRGDVQRPGAPSARRHRGRQGIGGRMSRHAVADAPASLAPPDPVRSTSRPGHADGHRGR